MLLARILCMAGGALGASSTEAGQLGALIRQGLGIASNAPTISTAVLAGPTTGSGLASAQSCAAALVAWSSASLAYVDAHGHSTTELFPATLTVPSTAPGTTQVTSLITLCDGHPRVVGHATTINGVATTSTLTYTNTDTTSVPATIYPTPEPCSIGPDDCKALYSSFFSVESKMQGVSTFSGAAEPPCSTATSTTVPQSQSCAACEIIAANARLLYWPVTTVPGSGDLCNKSAPTVPGARTASGPNTFVTGSLTITSPTVAVSFRDLSAVEGCGPTIASTILPVQPAEVTSIRGYHADFSYFPFNYADLNYHCLDTNSTNYTLVTAGADSCYQEVPAVAYFRGLDKDSEIYFLTDISNLTIYDDYRPQILPPQGFSSVIQSVWGMGCIAHPDGVWDPPIALQAQGTIALPELASWETTASLLGGSHSTAVPAAGSPASSQDSAGIFPSLLGGAASPGVSVLDTISRPASTLRAVYPTDPAVTGFASQSSAAIYIFGSETLSRSEAPNSAVILSNEQTTVTLSQGGAAATVGTQLVRLSTDGALVVGTGSEASTVAATGSASMQSLLTVGGETYAAMKGASGGYILEGASTTISLSAGGVGITIGSEVVSVASTSLVTGVATGGIRVATSSPKSHILGNSSAGTSGARRTIPGVLGYSMVFLVSWKCMLFGLTYLC